MNDEQIGELGAQRVRPRLAETALHTVLGKVRLCSFQRVPAPVGRTMDMSSNDRRS